MEILLEDVVFRIISDLDDVKKLRPTNKYLGNISQIYMEKTIGGIY